MIYLYITLFVVNNSTILSPNKPFETPTKSKEEYNFPSNTTPKYATSYPYYYLILFLLILSETVAVNKVDDTLLEPNCGELTLDHYASLVFLFIYFYSNLET